MIDSNKDKQYERDEKALIDVRDYVDVMRDEPEEWIKLSEVYHELRSRLGDE